MLSLSPTWPSATSLQNEEPFLPVGNFDKLYNSVDGGVVLCLRLLVGNSENTIFSSINLGL